MNMAKKAGKGNSGKAMSKQRGGNPQNLIGKGFRERPENINRKGRPRQLFSQVIQSLKTEYGTERLLKTDYAELAELVLNLTESEWNRLMNDKSIPRVIRMDLELLNNPKYYLQAKELILDRVWGRSTSHVEATVTNKEQPLFPDLPTKE